MRCLSRTALLSWLHAAALALVLTPALLAPARGAPAPSGAADQQLPQLLGRLAQASFADKATLIKQLAALHDARARAVLSAMLEENLYARSTDNKVFIAAEAGDNLDLTDPLTGQPAGTASADDLNPIGINNQLRTVLRVSLAQFDLSNADPAVRLAAVRQVLRAVDADTIAALRARLPLEKNTAVEHEIRTGLALADLDGGTVAARLRAVKTLAGSLNPEVYNRLTAMLQKADDGSYAEPDARVRAAAAAALRAIDR